LTHDEQPRTAPDSLDLPSFMLIGFMKAGTTYLRGLLDSHPELSTKSDMGGYSTETHFFDSQFTDETAESADLDQVRRAYAESFQGAGAQHKYKLFDDTPKYSRMDLERIRLLNATVSPETKFVVSLRDPIELTMSRVRMSSCAKSLEGRRRTIARPNTSSALRAQIAPSTFLSAGATSTATTQVVCPSGSQWSAERGCTW